MASGQGPSNRAPRPVSVSKDEDYARRLQEEENAAALEEDEQLARRMHRHINVMPGPVMRLRGEEAHPPPAPPLRSMTPITQLFADLVVHASSRGGQRQNQTNALSESEEDDSDSDTDTTVEENSPNASPVVPVPRGQRGRGGRGTTTARRSVHGMRPTETDVVVTPAPSVTPTRRGGTRGRSRGRAPRRGRGAGRISVTRRQDTSDTPSGAPQTMEPSTLPLSMALNRPELPRGETEPEIMLLNGRQSNANAEDRFIHIMRDPMLLILFLMGRRPELLVPDDVDPNDYESLWELAERIGEVKNRGMEEKEIKALPVKTYTSKTQIYTEDHEGPGCRVCLSSYKSGDKLCTLPCKHDYHAACVKEWLKRNANCPICRHDMKPS
ncbi:uncharacterized protein LOC134256138 isoform X2 [Saccostrea cucullata]|uniref:uncharacterized protein LOC134256138 isoform X2 n=1 Tax=Saccostrea cuccullata TaxID=36930 RepID=UPI002ED58B64